MAFDFTSKGWVLKKWDEKKNRIECFIERRKSLNKRDFVKVVEDTVENFKSEFPDLRIEVEYIRRVRGKSVEIIAMATNDKMFSVWMSVKSISVRIYIDEFEKILDCIE